MTNNDDFDAWRFSVILQLDDPDAINLTASPRTLEVWWQHGIKKKMVVARLNERWRVKRRNGLTPVDENGVLIP